MALKNQIRIQEENASSVEKEPLPEVNMLYLLIEKKIDKSNNLIIMSA